MSLLLAARQLPYVRRSLRWVLPAAEDELRRWEAEAAAIPTPRLRRLALASLEAKRFHSHGGSLYAASVPREAGGRLVRFIVALQTISDYLDNLCDRTDRLDGSDFRTLHRAMLDAVDPGPVRGDYYNHRPGADDAGYLSTLVANCRRELAALRGHSAVADEMVPFINRYNDLQVYKHLPVAERRRRVRRWAAEHGAEDLGLSWWEYGAACGSTLGVFALAALAARSVPSPARTQQLAAAYFPWITGLHILLDYLIDQAEDRREGDLNFVACYPDPGTAADRLVVFVQRADAAATTLPDATFHRWIVGGLPGIYLSDPKVERQGMAPLRHRLLAAGGAGSWFHYLLCWLQRRRASSAVG